MSSDPMLQGWLDGRVSLSRVKGWQPEEYQLMLMLGYTLHEQGRSEEAAIIFEGLLSLDPRNAYCHSALGAAYLRLEQDEKALTHLNMALQFDGRDISAYINRAELYMKQQNYKQAQADLEMAIKIGATLGMRNQAVKRAQGLLNTAKRLQKY
ncbi:MAG: tetratricopeptide repeat protein [Acidobacteriota bacterium]